MITLFFLLFLVMASTVFGAYIIVTLLAAAFTTVGIVIAIILIVLLGISLIICGIASIFNTKRWTNVPATVVRIEYNPATAHTKYIAIISANLDGRTEHIHFPTDIRFPVGAKLRCTIQEHKNGDDSVTLKITDLNYSDSY